MPRRRINPKKKSVRKREVDEWLQSGRGQALLATLELQESCPELTHDTLRRRQHFDESTNSFSFDLSGCSMTELPASIGSWKSSPRPLRVLNLSRCTKLTALPDEIGELTTLTEINLEGCASISVLPDAIGELGALRVLDLSKCSSLTALPDSIGDLQTLGTLHLGGCVRLALLPDTIGDLEALKGLSLVDCTSLSALPITIDELGALEALDLGGCSSLVLSRDALNGLGALRALAIGGSVKIESLNLDRNSNLKKLFAQECPNLDLTRRTILALHKQRVKVLGFSVREMMRELRDQAKRRRQRRLCDYCGRQGGIDEPRLPVCYCGRRRYCDETCQRAGWAHEHSENCSFGFLTALQIESLQKAEDAHSKGLTREAFYRALRGQILQPTAPWALARDSDDSLDGSCDSGDRVCGFTPSECDELLAEGVKPWDADAGAVLAALGAGDDSSSVDSTYANSLASV